MSLEDIIKKFPKIYQELARVHLQTLLRIAKEESRKWVLLMLDRKYEEAQTRLLELMSTQEAIDDTKALVEIMRQLNKEAKAEADMWREFFTQLFLLGLARVEKEIE